VAVGVLLLAGELRHGPSHLTEVKDRVIAPPVGAFGFQSNVSFYNPLAEVNGPLRLGNGDDAAESGGALRQRDSLELGEKVPDALLISGSGACIPGSPDPWLTI
jgi:hypothetical protein